MPPVELEFKIRDGGPLAAFTAQDRAVHAALWCDWNREVVELSGATTSMVRALSRQITSPSTPKVVELDKTTHLLLLPCSNLPHDLTAARIDQNHCLNLPPIRFRDGYEFHNVLTFEDSGPRRLLEALRSPNREVELVSKRPLSVQAYLNTQAAGVGSLIGNLTNKQLEALLDAHRHGLYVSPRRVTAAEIASARGLSRSTFEEHLRKAEQHVLVGIIPLVELVFQQRKASKPPTHQEVTPSKAR